MFTIDLIAKLKYASHLNWLALPEFSKVDGGLISNDEQIKYFVELKTRNHNFGTYDSAIIDYDKFKAIRDLEAITTIPTMLAYGWQCGTWGIVFPTKAQKYITFDEVTPAESSVSFNAGVRRQVAKIKLDAFRLYDAKAAYV